MRLSLTERGPRSHRARPSWGHGRWAARASVAGLSAAFGALGCAGTPVHEATARVHFYDDARITVVTPSVRDEVRFGGSRLAASYTVDVVGGATQALTVDAVSSATTFSDTRHQGSLEGGHVVGDDTEISAAYTMSVERDHTVYAPSIGVVTELLDQMVRASARYQVLVESIGRADDPQFAAHALGHRLDLGWTHILGEAAVLEVLVTATAYDCTANVGCFANPYRYVGVTGSTFGVLALPERHPDDRFTGAGAVRLAWALGDASALHFGYRLSGDSWGIDAHTLDAAFATEPARRWLLRAEARSVVQGPASFYRAAYHGNVDVVPSFRTADAELSSSWNVRLQVHVEWELGVARLVVRLGRQWSRYPDFASFPSRHAWMGGLGLDLEL